jgi:chloramphenicol-sensitive protein RarD
VPSVELLVHRVLWSCAVAIALVSASRAWPEVARCLRSRRHGLPILAAAWLLAVNWLTFLYAVETGRVLATSLGYYVTPLVNVALGMAWLGERLTRVQLASLGLAAVGVGGLALRLGEAPWIALLLAGSFGLYGLVRKAAPVGPVAGFGAEMLLLAPFAAGSLAWLGARGGLALAREPAPVHALMAGSGLVTALPLLWFNAAARRMRLATLGFFQYLSPSLAFLLAVFAYGEPFTRAHAFAFACVWLACALYSGEAWRQRTHAGRTAA